MKLHQLRIFESVARHLSVTAAAGELNLSQPAVSLQLKLLEQEYGTKFLERTNRGVALTRQGAAFLEAIRALLIQADKVDAAFKASYMATGPEVLVVGGSNTLSVTVLPEILVEFRKRHPEVRLELETSESRLVEEYVLSSRVQIGLVTRPSYLPSCIYEEYAEHEAVAFVPPDSPLCGKTLSLRELTRHPLVARKGSQSIQELKRRGYRLNLALQCDAPEAVKTAVRKGMGIGILFRGRVDNEIRKGDLRMLDAPEIASITTHSFIIYHKRKALSASGRDFLDTLRTLRGTRRPRTPTPAAAEA